MSKPLIVGIDIGTTTGLAIFDLDKNLLYTGSRRDFSTSKIIKEIMSFGNPLIISTDKKKASSKIKKIAASFNCKIFKPDHDLTIDEKNDIVRIPIKDAHEKDALASASFAYRHYETLFNNINRALNQLNLEQQKDRVKEMILTGNAKNIAEAIEKVRPKEEIKVKSDVKVKEVFLNWKERAKEKRKELKEKDRKYDILKIYTEKLEEKLKALERQKQLYLEEEMKKNEKVRKEILKEKELKKREIIIKQLNFELAKQKNLRETYEQRLKKQQEIIDIMDEGLVPVIKIPEFDKKSMERVNKDFEIKNKVVWIEKFKPSKLAARFLVKNKPKVIISEIEDNTRKFLKKHGIIIIDSVKPEMKEFYAAASPDEMKITMLKTEKRDFLKWLEDYRQR
jgi:predicted RNase H-like nuclease (RuvC/YqgF family)